MTFRDILASIYTNYIFRRFLFFLLIIWIASTAIFLIPRLSGQDPVKEKLLLEAQRGGPVTYTHLTLPTICSV